MEINAWNKSNISSILMKYKGVVYKQPLQEFNKEVNWLREAYTHKCSEVGYLSGVADRIKWLYDQSREQITSLKVQNEHLKEELEECEYLRKKLIEQINVEPKATKKNNHHQYPPVQFSLIHLYKEKLLKLVFNYSDIIRSTEVYLLNLKKNNNNGNEYKNESNKNDNTESLVHKIEK
ncbi:10769_t:CDS:2 [Funneliformis caledonium]|uniref:10769_t:CDS:1 n=1 Tax=Funneliformis caledonium TaxID=1117310 RepID=A0A9N9BDL2_9GLOM|nr:10769_t:CDS:2 [Funneliformis caledonium]